MRSCFHYLIIAKCVLFCVNLRGCFFFTLHFISHCTAEECREIPAPIEVEASNRCADWPRNSELALQRDLVYKKIRKQLIHIHTRFPVY